MKKQNGQSLPRFETLLPGLLLWMICFAGAVPPAAAENQEKPGCLNDVCFETVKDINGAAVPLRGIGLLEFLSVDLYTAAFYVPAEADTLEKVLGDTPKSLVIEYHHGIKVKWMNEAAEKTLKKNPGVNFPAIEERVRQIAAAYKKVDKNDRYELCYEPGRGTSLYLNGEVQITLPGQDFAAAYFGIWISDYPARDKLRDQLLNLSAG